MAIQMTLRIIHVRMHQPWNLEAGIAESLKTMTRGRRQLID